jgi:hypothetical protein
MRPNGVHIVKNCIKSVFQLIFAVCICTTCISAADNVANGKWKMSANTAEFDMVIDQSGGTISGTMTRTNGVEPVDTINGWVYDQGRLQFIRERANSWTQIYTGQIKGSGDNRYIEGTFTHNGEGAYPWSAKYSSQLDLTGKWKMVANTAQFDFDVIQSDSAISGTMTRTNGVEPVDTITGSVQSNGNVQFTRARPGSWTQVYTGQIGGSGSSQSMQGTFTHDNQGSYPWTAWRAA